MTLWQEENDLKSKIFERYPDLANVRPLGWKGGQETPTSRIVGVIVIPRIDFDGWRHLPVRDVELRSMARALLNKVSHRPNCLDEDAILVLAVLQ